MPKNKNVISVRNCSQNNLKNISIDIPKNKVVVVTGVSGSGKSPLVFDTLYAEGYRRYVENLSASARFFLQSAKKPKVGAIENLSPVIAISQKRDITNARSTVGTITGTYDFFRMIFAQFGTAFCPFCGKELKKSSFEEIIGEIKKRNDLEEIYILAKYQTERNDFYQKIAAIAAQGFSKARINGEIILIKNIKKGDFDDRQEVEVLLDRVEIEKKTKRLDRERIVDSLQSALKMGKNQARVILVGKRSEEEMVFNRFLSCEDCGFELKELSVKNFSFNLPEGACRECKGLGEVFRADLEKVFANKRISINEGGVIPWNNLFDGKRQRVVFGQIMKVVSRKYGIDLNEPIGKIGSKKLEKLFFGDKEPMFINVFDSTGKQKQIAFEGLAAYLEQKHKETDSNFVKNEIEKFLTKATCPVCQGGRLKKEYLAIKLFGKNIKEMVEMEVGQLGAFLEEVLRDNKKDNPVVSSLENFLSEIISRLSSLEQVSLGYLSLNRNTATLSGGEFQRTRMATQLFNGLSGLVYALDEPTAGLHPRDVKKVLASLFDLKNNNNSVIVVEHDKEIIFGADYLIDIGPGAGKEGGQVVFEGNLEKLKKSKTETARIICQNNCKEFVSRGRKTKSFLKIKKANKNNLKGIDVKIPLRSFICVAGVSGSGKSSLINDVLAKNATSNSSGWVGCDEIENLDRLSKTIVVDQSSIGQSSRSNAATFTGIFSHIRNLFAGTELAKKEGFSAGHFSFNVPGGRCEHCQGEGVVKTQMYLADAVSIMCSFCEGKKYSKKVLGVKYHGADIAEVLDMSVEYAYHFFHAHDTIRQKLRALKDVGLGYLKLGQSAPELSGGEAQRIKLATELSRKTHGDALYILDEPTVGLHLSDSERLVRIIQRLVDNGNSVVVVEHNQEVIRSSDWVIEIGPDGGKDGGRVVFEGTPEELKQAGTWTGKYL